MSPPASPQSLSVADSGIDDFRLLDLEGATAASEALISGSEHALEPGPAAADSCVKTLFHGLDAAGASSPLPDTVHGRVLEVDHQKVGNLHPALCCARRTLKNRTQKGEP